MIMIQKIKNPTQSHFHKTTYDSGSDSCCKVNKQYVFFNKNSVLNKVDCSM